MRPPGRTRPHAESLQPDAIVVYSTQWVAVLDQLWQTRSRISGLQVDENWHELGTLRFDIRTDTTLARACVRASAGSGIASKRVDYDGFPVDIGTIVVNAAINPDGEIPLLVAANNLYHDLDRTRRLGEIAVATAIEQGKRVVAIGIGGLSGTLFRDERPLEDDAIASQSDDSWNRQILTRSPGAPREPAGGDPHLQPRRAGRHGVQASRVDAGLPGGAVRGATVHAYGPTYGCGAAVIEFAVGDARPAQAPSRHASHRRPAGSAPAHPTAHPTALAHAPAPVPVPRA